MGHSPVQRSHRLRPDHRHGHNVAAEELKASEKNDSSPQDSRIHAWLNEIRACADETEDNDHAKATHTEQPWRPHNLPLAEVDITNRQRSYHEPGRRKDDMLLSVSSNPGDGQYPITMFSSSCDGNRSLVKQKRRRSSSCTASTPRTKELIFEKRPRRKTRSDKYDSSKRLDRPNMIKSKRASRSTRRKNASKVKLRSGREVMNNFASVAIANPRVTVVFHVHLVQFTL